MKDVYFIEFNGRYLIYRPLKRLAFIGNQALINYIGRRTINSHTAPAHPDIDLFLARTGYWEPAVSPEPGDRPEPARPTMAVLLMTNRCNLACTYCYASAGSHAPVDMSWPIARVVIDSATDNARINGDSRFGLSFHGGGEPTLNWSILTAAVSYARAQRLPCDVSLASNGIWTTQIRNFICSNIDSVTLSFDGVKAVQDAQRPRRSGSGSFESVMRSIRALDTSGVEYGIRMTVMPESFERLPESLQFLCNETGVRAIQIEASFTSSRGVYTDISSEDADRFVTSYILAERIGFQHDVVVSYSGARPWVISDTFCQAPSKAIIATPEGRMVACFEATGENHPYSKEFTIGHVTPNGVETDPDAYNKFQQSREIRRAKCGECFCYWHCCGDCASRAMISKAPTSKRCHVNREITKALIADYIERGNGIWMTRDSVPVINEVT